MVITMDKMIHLKYPVVYNNDLANRCVYGASFVREVLGINNYNNIYERKHDYPMSSRKLEGLQKISEEKNYYQENPVKFYKDFFNIQLLDSQAYLTQASWITPNVMICASRAYGKSFWLVLFAMGKQMLSIQPWNCYIASGSGQQSATTFKKLEDIANDRIPSLINSTGSIFKNELEVPNAANDGFSHNPSGFTYSLYNGSFTKSLNSSVDRNRGARSSCVFFDEASYLDDNLLSVYKAFCATQSEFATGFDKDGKPIDQTRLLAIPKPVPNQLIYVSSASSTDTPFYTMYRDFSKQMFMGNKDYFVAQIDCDLVMKPTIMNVRTTPALTKDVIESDMRVNPQKARREYYCEFTTDAGADAIIRRGVITRNESTYKPVLFNDTEKRKIVIAYDPARSRDNSVILVCEVYEDKNRNGDKEYKMRILNCVNLIDISNKKKQPMQTPDQIRYLKELILDYNRGGDDSYSNILGIYIDAGSGGGGVNIADFLMEDWQGKDGKWHRGLIDKEYSEEYVKKFPNAVNKLHLMSPTKMKSEMYEAMIEMMNQDKIGFTTTYDGKDHLTVFDIDIDKYEKTKNNLINKYKKQNLPLEDIENKVQQDLDKIQSVNSRIEKLDWQEQASLASIDAMKEELVNMIRIKRESGKDSFELCPEVKSRLHDDRAYCMAMASYALQCERRKNITSKKKPKADKSLVQSLTIRKGVRHSMFS